MDDLTKWCGIEFTKVKPGLYLPSDPVPNLTPFLICPPGWPHCADLPEAAWQPLIAMMKTTHAQEWDDTMHEMEQDVLRAHHGHRMQYAWSETLQAHLPIGEPLTRSKS